MTQFRLDKVKAVVLDKSKKIGGTKQPKDGYWHIVLNCYDLSGKRCRHWIPTGLPILGNARKVEDLIPDAIQAYIQKCEDKVAPQADLAAELDDRSFAAFARAWLRILKADRSIEQTTWEKYANVVNNHIVPFFLHKGLDADEVAPKHVRDYYLQGQRRADGRQGGRLILRDAKAAPQCPKAHL